jgi:hypothetical protein
MAEWVQDAGQRDEFPIRRDVYRQQGRLRYALSPLNVNPMPKTCIGVYVSDTGRHVMSNFSQQPDCHLLLSERRARSGFRGKPFNAESLGIPVSEARDYQ